MDIVERILEICSPKALREVGPAYLDDPRGRWQGKAIAIVAPAEVGEVSRVVRLCSETETPVIPFGGGTGLVGGQLLVDGRAPLILSLENMQSVRQFDTQAGTLTIEAGAILSDIHDLVEGQGWQFPLTLASQGSARLGGLLATNAGGVNVIRYGNARDLTLGIEAVLADGTIVNTLAPLKKNNTGYDLRHLLIGSEGTLGIITAACLQLYPQPASRGAALIVVPDPQAALDLLKLAQSQIGEGISAFELIGRMGFEFLAEVGPEIRNPLGEIPDWCCLVDLGLARGAPEEALEALFESAAEQGIALDGVVAQSEAQRHDLWRLRESIPEANRRIGAVSSHDISVPVAAIPDFVQAAPERLSSINAFRINCFGHLGDGNLHYNVFPVSGKTRADHEGERDAVKIAIHDLVHEFGGAVSAEHGIGRLKVSDLEKYGDPGKLTAMRAIKTALDPKNILNPGAVLRSG